MGLMLAWACGPRGPRAIAFGQEACSHCHMRVVDSRFSAQVITRTGKIYIFDDLGCLANWLREEPAPVASTWVWSMTPGEGWLPAVEAVYLQSDSLHTPMGSGLAAHRPGPGADSLRVRLAGRLMTWDEVRAAPHAHRPTPAS
jgi:copper chaperone NosL